jgi:cytochrome c oxidase subunit II
LRQTQPRPETGGSDRTLARALAIRAKLAKATVFAGGAAVLAACSGDQSALSPQGPYAQGPHDLITIVFAIALVVFVLVQGLIIYSVVKFRRKRDDDGSLPVQVHGNTKLEILWTVIPALILAGIAVPTVQGIFEQMNEPEDADTLVVEVIGHRWWWEFYYPEQDIYTANELVIPTDVPVRLQMTSLESGSADRGVLHSFWVPPLGGKQDVVPGKTTFLNLQADEPGRYLGQCAEYCGLSHVNMRNRVEALPAADFDSWVSDQQQPAAVPEDGTLEAEGRALFYELDDGRQACAQCHQAFEEGDARQSVIGPDLTHLFSREEFLGAIETLDEDTLRAWLEDPDALKPMQFESNDIGMPNLDLSEDELDALVAYLMTLE